MNSTMAMPINQATLMATPVFNPNVKDSRWLTLEVCREYTRNKCSRSDEECKFAHPPPHVEVQNGRVTCCFDSIKGKCQRKDPPCKYLHPPQHLKEQLLQNGRNNLILKNLQMQAMVTGGLPGAIMPGLIPTMAPQYLMQHTTFNPYVNNTGMGLFQDTSQQVNVSSAPSPQMHSGVLPATAATHKVPRPDRLESSPVIPGSSASGSNSWNGHPSSPSDNTSSTASQYNPIYFQGVNHVPGMVPIVKRPATLDGKSGIPMYQANTGNTSAYQQALAAMQLQQPYPVQNEYLAGHPPGMPRF